jgi:hypothetical protein
VPGWNWHLATEDVAFGRLPWFHRASPSTTLNETVKPTEAGMLLAHAWHVNGFFAALVGIRRARLTKDDPPCGEHPGPAKGGQTAGRTEA